MKTTTCRSLLFVSLAVIVTYGELVLMTAACL